MAQSKPIALVTGGSGYLGSVFVEELLARGFAVRSIDICAPYETPPTGAAFSFQEGDIRDPAAITTALRGAEIVFHCAAQVPLAKDPALFKSVNEEATRLLLESCERAGTKKVLYLSSSAVYGVPEHLPVNEDSPTVPFELYGAAKLAGETACREAVARGLDVSIVRPRTILGLGRLGIFQVLFEWVYQGQNLPVFGRGDNRYQFIHARDLVEASIRAALRPGARDYNVGAAEFGSMRETLEALCRHAKTGSVVKGLWAPPIRAGLSVVNALRLSPLGAYHGRMYGETMYFDISRARRELNWEPRYSNEAMILESYDWYRQNRHSILTHSSASHHRSKVKEGALKLVRYLC